MGKAIRESVFRTRLGECSQLDCLFVNREKGLFLSVCGRQKLVCLDDHHFKEEELKSVGEL